MAENVRRKDADLVLALAGGSSIRDAAQQAGISEQTVYRRLKDAHFRQSVDQTRGEIFEQAIGRLTAAANDAVATLSELSGSATTESVRANCAKVILDFADRFRQSLELERRVTALEDKDTNRLDKKSESV